MTKKVGIDFMFFKTTFIFNCVKDAGFDDIEIIERDRIRIDCAEPQSYPFGWTSPESLYYKGNIFFEQGV